MSSSSGLELCTAGGETSGLIVFFFFFTPAVKKKSGTFRLSQNMYTVAIPSRFIISKFLILIKKITL